MAHGIKNLIIWHPSLLLNFSCSLEPVQSSVKSNPVTSAPSHLPEMRSTDNSVPSNNNRSQSIPGISQCGSTDVKAQKCFICVTGMTCASCVSNIERNLLKHRGELAKITSDYIKVVKGWRYLKIEKLKLCKAVSCHKVYNMARLTEQQVCIKLTQIHGLLQESSLCWFHSWLERQRWNMTPAPSILLLWHSL